MNTSDLGLHGDPVIRTGVSNPKYRKNYDDIDWGRDKEKKPALPKKPKGLLDQPPQSSSSLPACCDPGLTSTPCKLS